MSWIFCVKRVFGFCFKNSRSFRKSPPLSAKNPQLAKKQIQPTISVHKKDPSNDESSLWSGRRGSNSRHPPWQHDCSHCLNQPKLAYYQVFMIFASSDKLRKITQNCGSLHKYYTRIFIMVEYRHQGISYEKFTSRLCN